MKVLRIGEIRREGLFNRSTSGTIPGSLINSATRSTLQALYQIARKLIDRRLLGSVGFLLYVTYGLRVPRIVRGWDPHDAWSLPRRGSDP